MISTKTLRFIIREAVKSTQVNEVREIIRSAMNEAGEDRKVSNAELVKGLKSGAAGIAKEIPQKYNDDFVDAMNTFL